MLVPKMNEDYAAVALGANLIVILELSGVFTVIFKISLY
jgi:hypothetical protein